jgi:monoamine oxidase
VIVLEARGRVGGRVLNHSLGHGKVIEAGGEWVGPTQDRVLALISELGLSTYPTRTEGNHVYLFEGTRLNYQESGPTGTAPPDPLIISETAATIAQLDMMAESVPVDAPWTAAKAEEWDAQTLESWLRDNTASERFRNLARLAVRLILGSETDELSLLFALFYIAAAGNEKTPGTFERLFSTRGGANQDRLHGGSQAIALRMARALGKRRIEYHQPVRRITQSTGGVRVDCDHLTVRARCAIVAIPPALAARIDYKPNLTPLRDQLMQRVPQGTLVKCEAIYDRPFWRDAGYSGFTVTDAGPCQSTYDNSPPDGRPGVLVGFIGGDRARAWGAMSDRAQRTAVLKTFAALFGTQALKPRDYVQMHWAREEWSRGAPVGVFPPGALTANGRALRPPQGRIHWAGTETSTYWNGYMEGAVRAGERAAREVLAGR